MDPRVGRHPPHDDLATRIALRSERIAFQASIAGLVLLAVDALVRLVG